MSNISLQQIELLKEISRVRESMDEPFNSKDRWDPESEEYRSEVVNLKLRWEQNSPPRPEDSELFDWKGRREVDNLVNFANQDLSNLWLSDLNISRSNFSNTNFSGARLYDAILDESVFRNTIFHDTRTDKTSFKNCEFYKGDFSYFRLFEINAKKSSWENIDFSKTNADGKWNAPGSSFDGCNMGAFDFSESDLTESSFRDCHLVGASFRGAYLKGAKLSDLQLDNCDFRGADLTNCDLSGSSLRGCFGDVHTKLTNSEIVDTVLDASFIDSLKDSGGLSARALKSAVIKNDFVFLQREFSGFVGKLHWLLLVIFLLPYAYFLIELWIRSTGADYQSNSEYLVLWEAFRNYIVSGGETWKELKIDSSLFWFIGLLVYNGLRLVLLMKTVSLKSEALATGLPVYFALSNRYLSQRVNSEIRGWISNYRDEHGIGTIPTSLKIKIKARKIIGRLTADLNFDERDGHYDDNDPAVRTKLPIIKRYWLAVRHNKWALLVFSMKYVLFYVSLVLLCLNTHHFLFERFIHL